MNTRMFSSSAMSLASARPDCSRSSEGPDRFLALPGLRARQYYSSEEVLILPRTPTLPTRGEGGDGSRPNRYPLPLDGGGLGWGCAGQAESRIIVRPVEQDCRSGPRHRSTGAGRRRRGGQRMAAILWEWVDMSVRWLHVIAGIAWIGSSFYFVHLDSSIKQRAGLPKGAGGEAWQVHGGGFYHMVKYLVAPERKPEDLTWFKWEAYATWLSGMALLVVHLLLRRRALPDRPPRPRPAGLGCGADQPRRPRAGLAGLRRPLQVAARPARRPARRGRLPLPGRARLRLHADLQRPRRLHADGLADRHDDGRRTCSW